MGTPHRQLSRGGESIQTLKDQRGNDVILVKIQPRTKKTEYYHTVRAGGETVDGYRRAQTADPTQTSPRMVKRSLASQNLTISQETHKVYFSNITDTITQKAPCIFGKEDTSVSRSPVESLRLNFDSQVE